MDYLKQEIDVGHVPVSIFIDLSKAFDTVNHSILLKKLSYYGVTGNALRWFENYLFERQQYVSWLGCRSDLANIHCGVPQGSVLGPTLFLIYINDMASASNLFKIICFADDTTLSILL